MVSVHRQPEDISFHDLVSVKIACSVTDPGPLEEIKDEIMYLRIDSKTDDIDLSDFDEALRKRQE